MHELSIALCIVDAATNQLLRHEGRARAVHLKLGALAGIVKESLLSAWECARRDSPLAQAELVLQDVPATAWCPVCDGEREIVSIQEFCCIQCGMPADRVIRGRELEIIALELTDDSDHATC